MSTLKRFVACASALALATGTGFMGAGIASAQDEDGATGSLGSSSIGDIGSDLGAAAEALNGPVTVTPNAEGGPTITFTNDDEGNLNCVGFTAPYSTVLEQDLDISIDADNIFAAIGVVGEIDAGGNVSLLVGENGEPVSYESQPGVWGEDNASSILMDLVLFSTTDGAVEVAAGEQVSWTAPTPDSPALAVVVCVPAAGGDTQVYTGIDKQVVVDQINGIVPGGSVTGGSVSGGSVATGASVLGSLGGGNVDGPAEEPVVVE